VNAAAVELRPYGDRALLALLHPDQVGPLNAALHRELDRAGARPVAAEFTRGTDLDRDLAGVVDVVPAACSVLIEFLPVPGRAARLAELIRSLQAAAEAAPPPDDGEDGPQLTIECRYDGADLADVATAVGESVEAVIQRHTAGRYVVQFCGFAPGFSYLTGLDPLLHMPRHSSPRARVAAGSVAIAGEFTAVYPRSSPGGWQLLGHTDAVLFDAARTPPALLPPGARVRFVAT
jgi:KipI family sensor histidine kinase inhibitor